MALWERLSINMGSATGEVVHTKAEAANFFKEQDEVFQEQNQPSTLTLWTYHLGKRCRKLYH